ncbi:MAG: transposase [Candidatus Nitrosotenuis sp.]
MFAIKSVRQHFTPNQDLQNMMDTFKEMVNHCIRIGLENNASTLKKLSSLSYQQLSGYDIQSKYKLNAISQAAGRLAQMKRDTKKGRKVRLPFVREPNQYLHKISKHIVEEAKKSRSMIVFEDLKGIRKSYRKGNGQGNSYRRKLNSWSFYELQRQVEYKAAWEGISVKFVNPKRTSMLCPVCGGRLQEDRQNRRKLLCTNCGKSMDHDVVASMNVAHKGWARVTHPRGLSVEAVKGNVVLDIYQEPLILRVDGSKLLEVSPR